MLLTGEDTTIQIASVKNRIKFFDKEGEELSPVYEGKELVFTEPEYANLAITLMNASEDMRG